MGRQTVDNEVIAKLPPNRQSAAGEGEERKRGVGTTLSLGDEAIAPRREGGWDESFAIASNVSVLSNFTNGLPAERVSATVFPYHFDQI